MESEKYYKSISFYVIELQKIKEELRKHETEYFPEKVSSLINAYKFTIKKILQNCEGFLDCNCNDKAKIEKVKLALNGYTELLKSLKKKK